MENDKQLLLKDSKRIEASIFLLLMLSFVSLFISIWLDDMSNIIMLGIRFLIGASFYGYFFKVKFKIGKLKNSLPDRLYIHVTQKLLLLNYMISIFVFYTYFIPILFKKAGNVDRFIGLEIISILILLVMAILDIATRKSDEEIGDEFSQKIRDEGARNAFYFSIFGLGAFQITMAVWVDFKNAIAAQFGAQAIDVSIIVSVFILIASWAIGQLYAHGKYR